MNYVIGKVERKMGHSSSKLNQALIDLIEAFTALDEEMSEKFGDDEDSYAGALIETLETTIEAAIDEQEVSTNAIAGLLSSLSQALEQIDPSAFEEEEEEEGYEYASDDSDINLEDDELEDIDDDDDED